MDRSSGAEATPGSGGAIRLRLNPHPSRFTVLDGAWWPRSTNAVTEIPQLTAALAGLRGEITHVLLNASEWDLPHPRRAATSRRPVRLGWHASQPAGLITIMTEFGDGRFDLMVVPPDASRASADAALTAAVDAVDKRHAPEPPVEVSVGASQAGDLLSPLVDAISRGSQEALAVLLHRTAEAIAAELTAGLANAGQRAAVLAGTYVEVWWLAGCRGSAESDVLQWIKQILHRRVVAARKVTSPPVASDHRPSCAELELAALLDRPIDHLWTVPACGSRESLVVLKSNVEPLSVSAC
ncbi:DUF5994 family protein [Actinoplanes sp. NBC_00393]|uniref:DUF5994 family protein n=1 Tax=Actinoplanes sp. NBC_00393 TaxID=2975953 RepID=UPI002E1BE28E